MANGLWRKIFGAPPTITSAPPAEARRAPEKKERRVEAKELPPFVSGAATEASPKHPDVNQDAHAVDAKRQLMMVADGIGTSQNGEVASDAARDAVLELGEKLDDMVQDVREETGSPYLTTDQMSNVMDAYFRMVADRVKEGVDVKASALEKSSTTLMVGKIFETAPGETYAVIKSVGDCQPMILRADGRLERVDIAEDSMFAARVAKGELSEDEAYMIAESESPAELTKTFLEYQAELGKVPRNADASTVSDAARQDIDRMLRLFNRYYSGARQERSIITAFVGGEKGDALDVHSAMVKLNPGDKLLLSTDGIDALKRAQIREALSRGATVEQAARMLVAAASKANERKDLRAKPDDITVVGMEVPRSEGRPGQRLVEAGFEEDVSYAQGTIDDLSRSLEAYYDAHPQIADYAVIQAGGNDPRTRKQYIDALNKYQGGYPGGLEAFKRDIQPFLTEAKAMQGRIDAMQSELTLAQARQQMFETERAAREDDPESPVWKKRIENARHRVTQMKRLSDMSRAQADVQGVEAARSKARALASKLEKT